MSLLDDVSLMITPNGVAEDVLFGVLPTPTTGNELITNGDFATDSDWVKGTGWAIAGNKATCTSGSASLTQSVGAVAGKTYKVTFTLSDYTSGTLNVDVGDSIASTFTSTGTYEIYLTTTNTNGLEFYGGAFRGSITDVSIKSYLSSDINFTRATTATKVNSAGLVASVATGVPRLDYTGGGCPHILAEPQRTNLFTYSEDFSQFPISNRLVITPNNITSPEGTINASKMQQTDGVTTAPNIASSTVSADTYSVSAFAKKGTRSFLAIHFDGTSYFDLQNGTITTTGSGHTASIENFGNDWYRCYITKTISTTKNAAFYFADTNNTLTTADDEGYMYLYGTQLEAASYSTSYIPTSGSTVTRNKDVFTRTGISDLINSAEGVLFLEASTLSDGSGGAVSVSDGTSSNYIYLYFHPSGTKIVAKIVVGGITKMDKNILAIDETLNNKFAFKYNATEFAVWVNGSEVTTEVGFAFPSDTLNRLGFDNGAGSTPFYGKVKQLQVYKTALTDVQLAALTT